MIPTDPQFEAVPRSWPVLAGLAVVAILLVAMLASDLLLAHRVAYRTSQIVDDDQRSIELVDDLRDQAERLTAANLSEDKMVQMADRIGVDVQAYEALTVQNGEREEWMRLRSQIDDLRAHVRVHDLVRVMSRIVEIRNTVPRLVLINREAARQQATTIRKLHLKSIAVDGIVGTLALGAVAAIVLFVLRILSRQRTLLERHIALLSERNRELDAFAGRAAHDLRVPLNPIRGYADLLMTGAESSESVQQMSKRIRIAVDRMSRVVDDMLELSRAGRPGNGSASPSKVCAEVLEELHTQLGDAHVQCSFADEHVACAPGVLAQLLRNVLSNAMKFRSMNTRLILSLKTVQHVDSIELIVEDNGIGINEQDAAHAFEPYYRGSEHREVPGHGLGLAIVHRTLEALGGTCVLSSSSMEGTSITLRLPRASA